VKIDEEIIDENLISSSGWPSTVDKKVVVRSINSILKTYINSGAISEVCISEDFLRKMKKRIQFFRLYGPAIFDEALTDPILTMKTDLLPRFKVSDTVNKMVRIILCSPFLCYISFPGVYAILIVIVVHSIRS
jgi:hypothetical protein